jgi:trehalose synthase
MSDAGLDVEWRIMQGTDEFYNVTKAMHNALQGDPRSLTGEEREIFARYNAENAANFSEADYDYVIVHDPQPAAMIDAFPSRTAKWIWRGHIDFSTPNPDAFDILLPSLRHYDASIFHMREYAPKADGLATVAIWPPAIDPLQPKNMALSPEDAAYIVDQFGIDVERPLLVKRRFPEVQLALIGSMAHDDPEGWEYYNRTVEHAGDDPDIYILSNMNNVGGVEVNAFQVHSDAALQKSTKEGFGLTVTEALWKARPMVAGRVGGIVAQIENGETGWLVGSIEECAEACIEILRDPVEARRRALKGKEHVRRHFLTPRLLRDWLVLFNKLAGRDTGDSDIVTV